MPKVSAIIPTYNRATFLRGAITSVLKQSFQDFEILVVDDASVDNTAEVVRSFNDERIKYIRHAANKGGSAARNTGIVNSSCQYIAFLDDDDEWLPEKLDMQVSILEKSPPEVGGIYTSYLIIDRASGKILGQKTAVKRGDLADELLTSNCLGGTSSVILRRKCFEKVGLFDETLPSFQDYDMWLRISREFQFECINQPLFKYYTHENKIWTNLEALKRGMEIMLKKYAQSPMLRKYYSYHYLTIGVEYCYRGDVKKGRQAYLTAVRLHPLKIRPYFNLCLSLFGAVTFKKLKEVKEKLVAPLRG